MGDKHELDHPCKETCSGWKQGFEKGRESLVRELGTELGPANAGMLCDALNSANAQLSEKTAALAAAEEWIQDLREENLKLRAPAAFKQWATAEVNILLEDAEAKLDIAVAALEFYAEYMSGKRPTFTKEGMQHYPSPEVAQDALKKIRGETGVGGGEV